jgi:hypothetical protein
MTKLCVVRSPVKGATVPEQGVPPIHLLNAVHGRLLTAVRFASAARTRRSPTYGQGSPDGVRMSTDGDMLADKLAKHLPVRQTQTFE